MIFRAGRSNLACTIFVPFDCKNHCPFCTSKDMYGKIDKDLDKVISTIHTLNKSTFFSEYVLTGGEPTADLEGLKRIINAVEGCGEKKKKVFINTTLPKSDNLGEIIKYINDEPKIAGVNISRHIGWKFDRVASLTDIKKIKKPVRINTVINKNFDFDKFLEFAEEYGGDNRLINLRADYTTINDLTLKNRDDICNKLLDVAYNIGNGGCMVCHENEFVYKDNIFISYHRGLQYSSFKIRDDLMFVNDIIVLPDGTVYPDWDFKTNEEFLGDLGLC